MKKYQIRPTYRGGTEVGIFNTQVLQPAAALAQELLARWGMVSAVEDGEDSAGRAKVRLQGPQEMVMRACATAELAYQEFKKRGWVLDLPDPMPPKEIKEEKPGE